MSQPCIIAQTIGAPRNNATSTNGFKFQATAAITVEQLGRWVIAGNALTHQLTLYDWTAAAVIASVVVDCAGAPTGDYLYGAIAPTVLVAGQTYSVESAELNGGDQFGDQDSVTAIPDFAVPGSIGAVFNNTNVVSSGRSYGPTNFIGFSPDEVGTRAAQIAAEVLAAPAAGLARAAQIAAEVLSAPNPGLARTAQIVVEVLHSLDAVAPPSGGTGAWFKVLEGDIFTDRDLVD